LLDGVGNARQARSIVPLRRIIRGDSHAQFVCTQRLIGQFRPALAQPLPLLGPAQQAALMALRPRQLERGLASETLRMRLACRGKQMRVKIARIVARCVQHHIDGIAIALRDLLGKAARQLQAGIGADLMRQCEHKLPRNPRVRA
jgi:hypothetical protein